MIRVVTCFCLLNILITESRSSTCDGSNCSSSTSEDENWNSAVHKVWLSQLFEEAKQSFIMDQSTNSMCKRDFDLYKMHLQNHSIWAIRMMESSEWPSVGIFSGTVYHMGNWRECVQISKHGINGKYCIAQVTYDFSLDPDQNITYIEEFPDEKSSVWVAIKMYRENPVRLDRQSIKWAICMPSSCQNTDLELALNKSVKPIFRKYGFNSTFYVNNALCSVKEEVKMFQNLPLIKTVVTVWIIMLIGCTMYDVIENYFSDYEKDKHEIVTAEFLRSFSIARSIKHLFTVSPSDQPPINLIKIVAMVIIVTSHLPTYIFGYPVYNSDYIEEGYDKYSISLSHSATVDLFFAISGLHTFYYGFESTKKGGCFYLICSLIIRWLRMVPAFGILSLFIIYIFPFLSDGPLWNERVMHEVNNCKETAWSNFLAINNFIKPEKQCLIVSWYISIDIQLSILGCILMYIISKNRKYGAIISFLMFLIGQAITFAVVYINNYYGLIRAFMSFLEDPRRNEEFNRVYVATYSRISPYMVGFATAFFAHYLKKRNYVFPKVKSRIILIGLLILSELSQIYGQKFFKFTYKYNRIENALYAALNRWIFVLAYGFLGLQYFTSGLDPYVDKIANHKFYVPIGRLTYSVFLINCLVQIYVSASQADLMPTSTAVNFPVWSLGILTLTYIAGFIFHVTVEAPFVNLSKLLQHTLIRIFVKPKTETDKSVASSPQVEDFCETGDNIAMDGYNKNPNQVIK